MNPWLAYGLGLLTFPALLTILPTVCVWLTREPVERPPRKKSPIVLCDPTDSATWDSD